MSEEVRNAVEKARSAFQEGRTRDFESRRELLRRLEEVIKKRRDDILAALSEDLGKPGLEAYLSEYHFLLQEIRYLRRNLGKWLKRKRVVSPPYFWPCRSWIEREPFGVVLVMAPWNYPMQLSLSPVMAAIAAGNTVVLKPSEMARASETLIVEIVQETFAKDEVVAVTGGVDTAEALLGVPFDFIFFTGSTRVGRKVAAKAAETLTPVLLELGGKCPCVIDEGLDLPVVARRILAGKFFNGGQTCFAPDFVLVSKGERKRFVEACRVVLEEVPWADEMAKMISPDHAARILKLAGEGALVFGEDDLDSGFVAPRLLPEASWDDEVMKQEIFGPLLPVVAFENETELTARLAALDNPLAIYCFSKREDFIGRMTRGLPSGSLCVNDTMKQFSQLKLPLGGVGQSGFGRYRGRFGVESLSYQRSVTRRYLTKKDFGETLPPYQKAYRWVKKFLK
jgi:aldehyde dehydrogenase (NAD+)